MRNGTTQFLDWYVLDLREIARQTTRVFEHRLRIPLPSNGLSFTVFRFVMQTRHVTATMKLASARIIRTASHLSEAEYLSRFSPLRYSLWRGPSHPPPAPRRDRRSRNCTARHGGGRVTGVVGADSESSESTRAGSRRLSPPAVTGLGRARGPSGTAAAP